MEVIKLGEGKPEYSIVGSLHGDEPCGAESIRILADENIDVKKPVQFIIANKRGLEQQERYLDKDPNRCFPGDLQSKYHGERLAAKVSNVVEDTVILDLHSTQSYEEPFCVLSNLSERKLEMAESTGVKKVAFLDKPDMNALNKYPEAITVECGLQNSVDTVSKTYKIIKNFLAAEGALNQSFSKSHVEVFRAYDTVRKPSFNFVAENFEIVEEGKVYARLGEKELRANESFHPVLMSSDGYNHILGHKAQRVSRQDLEMLENIDRKLAF